MRNEKLDDSAETQVIVNENIWFLQYVHMETTVFKVKWRLVPVKLKQFKLRERQWLLTAGQWQDAGLIPDWMLLVVH